MKTHISVLKTLTPATGKVDSFPEYVDYPSGMRLHSFRGFSGKLLTSPANDEALFGKALYGSPKCFTIASMRLSILSSNKSPLPLHFSQKSVYFVIAKI